jgi:hypothetical protein
MMSEAALSGCFEGHAATAGGCAAVRSPHHGLSYEALNRLANRPPSAAAVRFQREWERA